jgi:hypothetical protein
MDAAGRWSGRTVAAEAASVGFVLLVVALAVPGVWRSSGAPMEEGFMLVFPELVAEGWIPHRDFLHLYGPGSLWALGAVYRLFGATIEVERAVGTAQILLAALAVWALGRSRGRVLAAAAGATTAIILLPLGLVALAWVGGLAAGLLALAALAVGDLAQRREPDATRRVVALDLFGGVAAAVAVLYRPDLVLAVGAGLALWCWQVDRRRRTTILLGAAATSSLWLVHLWRSGPVEAFRGMVVEPVLELRAGRSLPVPPSWDRVDAFLQRAGTLGREDWVLPVLPESVQIHLWFWLVPLSVVVALAGAWTIRRASASSWAARSLVPFAVTAGLLLPQALQRPDVTHLSWVSAATFPAALLLGPELLRRAAPGLTVRAARVASLAVLVLVAVLVVPSFPLRGWTEALGRTISGDATGFPVVRGGRSFPYGSASDAAAAQEVVDELSRSSRPGERLVVGPADLSRTVYSDAWLYSLFDELQPGTRFVEMDPGIADAPDSGLADEVADADWVVLSEVWRDWDEPNGSRSPGSSSATEELEASFCEVIDNGRFRLLQRCAEGPGRPGATGGSN